ncbi:Armdomain-containing protein [Moniliophthora roreri]|uniref:Protein kinase domain-containing protein n=1 Tax=Moniliophthora roreri TaxID=221103 RepID=A0A0W0EXW8_MONRR|nr:Armdomain-containing protein [Moniliophthora roreri]
MFSDDIQHPLDVRNSQVIGINEIAFDPPTAGNQKYLSKGTWNEKRVIVKRLTAQSRPEQLARQATRWHEVKHPNVLNVYGISAQSEDPQFIVLPLQENGNIGQWITSRPTFDCRSLIMDIALGMQYLHARGIIHGSLKPTNILIEPDGRACVADYDMLQVQPSRSPDAHRYYSPEAWKGTMSKPSDVFAFAMCLLEIFTSTLPWGVLTEDRIYRLVVNENARPDRPDDSEVVGKGLDDKVWGIIEECWDREARLRPNFDIIVKMWNESPAEESYSSGSQKAMPTTFFPDREATTSPVGSRLRLVARNSVRSYATGPPAYHEFGLPSDSASSSSSMTSSVGTSSSRGSGTSPFNSPPTPLTPPTMLVKQLPSRHSPLPHMPSRWSLPTQTPTRQLSADCVAYHNSTRNQTPQTASFPIQEMNLSPAISPRNESFQRTRLPQRSQSAGATPVSGLYSPRPFSPGTLETIMDNATLDERSGRVLSDSGSTISRHLSALLVVQALQSEVNEGRKKESVDGYLMKMYEIAVESDKEAFKLVNAGAVPTLIHLLKARAAEGYGVELVLIVLGTLAHDSISANIIFRTGTAATLVEISNLAQTKELESLSIWCLSRICRTAEVANGLIRLSLPSVLLRTQSRNSPGILPSMSMLCLGTLIQSDGLADYMASMGLITVIATHLRRSSEAAMPNPEDLSAGLYALARISRSIKLAKAIAKAGCVEILAHHLKTSTDPEVLHWSARSVGCLMRPNSSDISKILLQADIARGLARLPTVLPPDVVYPLGSFGFTIQRFSCAEWGGSTRKALVEAGVVDSLLAALRTAADEYQCYDVHIELALAISLLGDVGGSAIRKEIVNAGGIDILKSLSAGATGNPDVSKACNMAITSITGNLFSRNAASAKTAMAHNWNGGCADYHPPCPVTVATVD